MNLTTTLLRRRRLDRSATIYGVIGGSLLIGAAIQWIRLGKIPIIEEFARQMGLTDFLLLFQIIAVAFLFLILLRGLLAVLRTRLEASGEITFTHDGIKIKKGKLAFSLSGESLQTFSIQLPKSIKPRNNKLQGGCKLNVPSPEGTFSCEFDLADNTRLEQLQQILHHMETAHQIKITREDI